MCFRRKVKKAEKKVTAKDVKKTVKTAKKVAKTTKKVVKEVTSRVYHVSKREDGKWQVKFAGGEKAIKLFDTQKEAVDYTRQMTKNQDGAMLIHNSKGQNKGKIKSK